MSLFTAIYCCYLLFLLRAGSGVLHSCYCFLLFHFSTLAFPLVFPWFIGFLVGWMGHHLSRFWGGKGAKTRLQITTFFSLLCKLDLVTSLPFETLGVGPCLSFLFAFCILGIAFCFLSWCFLFLFLSFFRGVCCRFLRYCRVMGLRLEEEGEGGNKIFLFFLFSLRGGFFLGFVFSLYGTVR